MSVFLARAKRSATFKDLYPEWADMAAEVLFRRDAMEPYDLQYAVAQALMVAYEMGQQGRNPPKVQGRETRRYEVPPPDPDLDEILAELRHMAWSPLSGVTAPEGHYGWVVRRREARASAPKNPVSVRISRRK